MKNDKEQLKKVQTFLRKTGNYDDSPEERIENDQAIIKEYLKKGAKNLDTIYKVEDIKRLNPGMSQNYAYELAKLSDNAGKRVNDPEYMQQLRNDFMDQGLSYADSVGVLNHLRAIENNY